MYHNTCHTGDRNDSGYFDGCSAWGVRHALLTLCQVWRSTAKQSSHQLQDTTPHPLQKEPVETVGRKGLASNGEAGSRLTDIAGSSYPYLTT